MKTTFPEALIQHLEDHPQEVILNFLQAGKPDLEVTYQKLYSEAAVFAENLNQAGIQPGEVVVLIVDYRLDLLYSFWGTVLHGAIPAILPFLTEKLKPERYLADLSSLIEVTRPAAIITYEEFKDHAYKAAHSDTSVHSILILEEMPKLQPSDPSDLQGLSRAPEDIAILQHSSGTTGLQKGVALSHQAVFNQLTSLGESIRLDPNQDVIVSWLPLYHDMGLIAGFILPILSGVPLVLLSPFDWVRAPYRLLQAVSDFQGTLSWLPNFAYNFCSRKIRTGNLEGVDLSSWRAVINCSEPVRWESHLAFFEKFSSYGLSKSALQTSYAMAENTFGITQSNLEDGPATQLIDQESFHDHNQIQPVSGDRPHLTMMSSGRPLNNTKIRVQDPDGKVLPECQIGEISIQSDSMLSEYFRRPKITEESFRDDWFLTGDFGYVYDGELFVTGRKKDMIIVGGKNIYPADLEELLNELPGVHPGRVVIFGIFNEKLGTEDVVAIAEADDQDPEIRQQLADSIRAHINQNSPVSLRYIKITDPMWIIKTSSGKVSRSANKQKYLAENLRP